MKINPDYLRNYGWRFIPSHDRYLSGQLAAVPECWQHDEWGEAATAEEADAITQANCTKVDPYACVNIGPPPCKPSLFARLFARIGEKRRGWSGRRED